MRPLFAMTLAALLVPATAVGQGPPQGPPNAPQRGAPMARGPQGMGRMGAFQGVGFGMMAFAPRALVARRARLELTDDQVKQLETLASDMEQARDKTMTEVRSHRDKLRELWDASQIDVNAVQSEARALMQVQQAAHLQELTDVAKAKSLLTAEQRGRVEGWAEARRWSRRGPGFRPGAGFMGRGSQSRNGPRGPMRRF
jgi:Spy/CpxP family protein refolding chaperone